MIRVTVNAKMRELPGPMGLLEFLAQNNLRVQGVAVGYNGDVVHRSQYGEVLIQDGDVLDIVHAVGGG